MPTPVARNPSAGPAAALVLELNLVALGRSSPLAVEAIRAASPRPDVTFFATDDADESATIEGPAGALQLASRRRPIAEARRLAETVRLEDVGGVAVLGFGLGHHVRELARRLKRAGVIVVYEPDAALLRAVLERTDHAAWLRESNVVIVTGADDAAAIAAAAKGVEGILALGVKILEHPPSRDRLAPASARFCENLTSMVRALRTTVVTTLLQAEVTLRNQLMNVDRYAESPGIADLTSSASGKPAIVVSAGPSLHESLDLLARPGVRERFVIIAVQTVLKPLLERGIKPHFVTALDYHEISSRFYEGLTARDVEGVMLVCEAKANPAIPQAFPGRIRFPADPFLDDLLGPGLAGRHGSIRVGATVAHLAYYLARAMGADPVILVGQDLAFTDGLYYGPGAAIHRAWSSELNPFRTLEMFEWERIARNRRHLHRAADRAGRPIYTDEQMATYLHQFERDFLADARAGLTTIDASGGVCKKSTTAMPLAAALDQYRPVSDLMLPATAPERPIAAPGADSILKERLRDVRQQCWRVGRLSRDAGGILAEMADHLADQPHVNRLIARVNGVRDEVTQVQPAFALVHHLNQTGSLKRLRADRRIELAPGITPTDRQRMQIERDRTNVSWLADASDQLGSMLDSALGCLDGQPKVTRDPPAPEAVLEDVAGASAPAVRARSAARVAALIPVDLLRGSLGGRRELPRPIAHGRNALQLTLARLARTRTLAGVILLAVDPASVEDAIGSAPAGLDVRVAPADPRDLDAPGIDAARRFAPECWRGALGGLSVYDEVCRPRAMLRAMGADGPLGELDAAALIGPDWPAVDPALIDAAVERFREHPLHRFTFCQAPPGVGTGIVARPLMAEMAEKSASGSIFATLGGSIGYVPFAPSNDPIVKPWCVTIDAPTRDIGMRLIADSPARQAALAAILHRMAEDAPASAIARALADDASQSSVNGPSAAASELVLELTTDRTTAGPRLQWLADGLSVPGRGPMPIDQAERTLRAFAERRPDGAVTFGGLGDPLRYPDLPRLVSLAGALGLVTHVRTDLLEPRDVIDRLLAARPGIVSVDLLADTAETYVQLTGADAFSQARANVEYLLSRRSVIGGLLVPWVVPRITRCRATLAEIEPFYDRWLAAAGAAVIDPLPTPQSGDTCRPLPPPADTARRLARSRIVVRADGTVAGKAAV